MKNNYNNKIGIITYYQIDNYGANLQAYAMLLLFNNSALVRHKCKAISGRNSRRAWAFLKECNNCRQALAVVINSIYTKRCFIQFRRERLSFCNSNECAAMILGGDQIWNTDLNNGDLFYFQNFSDIRTFSYAASFGYTSFPRAYQNTVNRLLKRMEIIAVREIDGKKLLKRQFNIESLLVLDPVFLIPVSKWKHEFNLKKEDSLKKGFVFYQREISVAAIDSLSRFYPNLKFDIYTNSIKKGGKIGYIRCGTVEDWLSRVYSASIIITTSYHAIVYAIMFKKNFVYVRFRSDSYSSRFISLFTLLGVSYDIEPISNVEEWFIPSLKYADIDQRLESLREQSFNTIKNIEGETFEHEFL